MTELGTSIDKMLERVPPQNIEAEMAVLGSMLIEETAIADAIETLERSYFYKEAHRKIFLSIINLFDANKPVDIVTLIDDLKKRGQLEEVGGPAYVTSLTTVVPTAANINHYAKIVKEKALLRSLITTATQIISEGYESDEDVDKLIDKAEKLIFEITSRRIERDSLSLKEVIKSSIETIDALYQRKASVTGIPTGFLELDVMTAGLQASDLIVIAGRPSMGKSALV